MTSAELITCIDLTRLQHPNTPSAISALCRQATTIQGSVAALCIYPPWLKYARQLTAIKLATVVNFPTGNASLTTVLAQINYALNEGADEIDLVLPYQTYQHQPINHHFLQDFIAASKRASGTSLLKVILETGACKLFSQVKMPL